MYKNPKFVLNIIIKNGIKVVENGQEKNYNFKDYDEIIKYV